MILVLVNLDNAVLGCVALRFMDWLLYDGQLILVMHNLYNEINIYDMTKMGDVCTR